MGSIDSSNASFLSSVERLQARADRAQMQISSGFRVNQASDDPWAVNDILALHLDLAESSQVLKNLQSVKTETDAADVALSKAVSLVETARTLGVAGAGPLVSEQERRTLALQVQSILEQMVGLSRTQVGGRFIFSGDRASEAQYKLDLSKPTGVERLFQTPASREIRDAAGSVLAPDRTAAEIFDPRDANDNPLVVNVFSALNQLRLALESNSVADITLAVGKLEKAHGAVSEQLAFYGAVQNRIANAISIAQNYQITQQSELSNKRDADIAAAILDLTQARNNLQAAMQARASRFSGSLFDFLK